MDSTRELEHIRTELATLRESSTKLQVELSANRATTEQRVDHVLEYLDSLRKELDQLNTSVRSLQSLALEGQSSLRTLLWIGGAVASITAFVLTLYSYLPIK